LPYAELHWKNAHAISETDIEQLILGSTRAAAFVAEYGRLDREFIQSLLAPARDDPWQGRAIFVGGRGGGPPRIAERRHVRRGRGPIFGKYEKLLARFGLGANMEAAGCQTQHIVWPVDHEPPLQFVKSKSLQLENLGIPGASARTIPISVHLREIPGWTASDGKIREYILHRIPGLASPKAKTRRRFHNRACELCALIYLWFRCLLPAAEIAEELGLEVACVEQMAMNVRTHGYFEGKCGCKNWGMHNQYGPTKKASAKKPQDDRGAEDQSDHKRESPLNGSGYPTPLPCAILGNK
jgi:hypothetical protein